MGRESTIRGILRIRKRFQELIKGRTSTEVYRMIALEIDEDIFTVECKKNCYGYYKIFLQQILLLEKDSTPINQETRQRDEIEIQYRKQLEHYEKR